MIKKYVKNTSNTKNCQMTCMLMMIKNEIWLGSSVSHTEQWVAYSQPHLMVNAAKFATQLINEIEMSMGCIHQWETF